MPRQAAAAATPRPLPPTPQLPATAARQCKQNVVVCVLTCADNIATMSPDAPRITTTTATSAVAAVAEVE